MIFGENCYSFRMKLISIAIYQKKDYMLPLKL